MKRLIDSLLNLTANVRNRVRSDQIYAEAAAQESAGELQRAYDLYCEASALGNRDATVKAAWMRLKGSGVPCDWAVADRLLALASNQGQDKVVYLRGMIHGIGGYGLRRNFTAAEQHLKQARDLEGDPEADQMLDMMRKRKGVFGTKEVRNPQVPWK
jgi:TPR repeat protein